LWNVPRSPWRNIAAAAVLNNWQISGIASFISGRPSGVTFTTTSTIDITGSPTDGARLNLTGDPILSGGEKTFSHAFQTDAFSLPAWARMVIPAGLPAQTRNQQLDVAIFKNIRCMVNA